MLKERNRWRLAYHLMPPDGWLNDPNGLCQMDGIYHIYFQYAPNTPAPDGRKARTWGQYAGPDLIHLDFEGVPFWPEELDRDGCYSGSALVEDGMIHLYYTGNIKQAGDYDYIHDGRISNTILVQTPDGKTYGEKKFLFGTDEYPKECTRHVRDPKVWKDGDTYYMVQGARMQDEKGAILLYKSENRTDWSLVQIISTKEPFGYMWECPDYFELGGKKILSLCPQGVESGELKYQNLYQSGYYFVDGSICEDYQLSEFHEWDYGFDFYAPQSFLDEGGRRILIGWSGMPDKPYGNPTSALGWENCLTVPRVLSVEGDAVKQNPVPELKELRGEMIPVSPDGKAVLPDASGDIEIAFADGTESWRIEIGGDAEIAYADGIVSLRMSEEGGYGRTVRKIPAGRTEDIRILVDRSMLEFFINGGVYASASHIFPVEEGALTITFDCKDAGIQVWRMKNLPFNAQYAEES